jgi:DHA2 family multidrug resistance protein
VSRKVNPWIIAVTVTLATLMEVLDTSIANVALPHIAGSLGATQHESTWILTSYLVANAVALPVAAYLSSLIGRKRFYMTCVAIFGVSSILCGLAPSLPMLLMFRVIQGAGGGGLGPSEQAILADTFPPEKRGQAFALYGVVVVMAPTIGPTIGGWITDNYDWRWIFFINVPVAILSLFLTYRLVEDPPAIKAETKKLRKGKLNLDYIGFGLVALAFGSLEVVLDKGQEEDWFYSSFVTVFFALAVGGLIAFVIWELWQVRRGLRPVLDLRLFQNRNLAISFGLMFVTGFILYATLTMIPQLLQSLMGYTAELAGLAISAGGLTTLVMMPLVGIMIGKVDPRYLVVFGFVAMCAGLYYSTGLNLQMSFDYASRPEHNNDVAGLTNLARNIGGSCGTSFFTTVLARHQQTHQQFLVQHAVSGNPGYLAKLDALTRNALGSFASQFDAQRHAMHQFYTQLQQQASVLSYIDVMTYLAIIAFVCIPLPLLLRKPPKGAAAVAH